MRNPAELKANRLSPIGVCLVHKPPAYKSRQTPTGQGDLGVVVTRWPKATSRSSVWNSSEQVVKVISGTAGRGEENVGIPGGASPSGATGT